MTISFVPLIESHFPLILDWFNKAHVQAFYSLREWTLADVYKKFTPHLNNEKGLQGYIVSVSDSPIGYIQKYPLKEHGWKDQELSQEIVDSAAGIDLLIGDENYLYKGFGGSILRYFLAEHIWPFYHYCLADPNIHNKASIRLFEKSGFKKHKIIETQDTLKRPVKLQLFILIRNF